MLLKMNYSSGVFCSCHALWFMSLIFQMFLDGVVTPCSFLEGVNMHMKYISLSTSRVVRLCTKSSASLSHFDVVTHDTFSGEACTVAPSFQTVNVKCPNVCVRKSRPIGTSIETVRVEYNSIMLDSVVMRLVDMALMHNYVYSRHDNLYFWTEFTLGRIRPYQLKL